MNAPVDISPTEFVQTEHVIRFLQLYQPQGPWVLWAKEADGTGLWCSEAFYPGDEEKIEAWVIHHAFHNQYYHVNPYPAVRRSPRGALVKANKTDIPKVRYLHVDVDPATPPVSASDEEKKGHTEAERGRIYALLAEADPTFLVDSGGGFQALFGLAHPIELDGTEEMANEVARLNHELAMRFGGDVAAKDVSRVLRLPGTTNWPDKKKREKGRKLAPTALIRHCEKAFPLSDFPLTEAGRPTSKSIVLSPEPVAAGLDKPNEHTISKPMSPTGPDGLLARLTNDLAAIIRTGGDPHDSTRWPSRSEAVYFVACSLVRLGCSDEEIVGVLTNSDYRISEHVRDQKNSPREYALRQARSARADVSSGPLVLSRANPPHSAAEFVRGCRPNLMHTNGEWLDYNGSSYQEVEEATIKAETYRLVANAVERNSQGEDKPFQANKKSIADILDALQAQTHRPRDSYFPPCWLHGEGPPPGEILACANGLVHLPTGELLAPTPAFYTRNALAFPYDRDAPPPERWLEILGNYWPNSSAAIATLQEIMGYLLVPDTSLHKIFMFIGPPRCGKSTIAQVITHLVGQQNSSGPSVNSLATPFGMEPLIGKQLAIIGDMRIGRRTDEAAIAENLLRVSGGDMVTIHRKYKSAWDGRLPTRFLILSNELPQLTDASTALANRYLPLVFTESFLGREDPELLGKLLAERPGILKWAIEGWRRLKQRGRFELPAESREALGSLVDMGSPIISFVDEHCELDVHALIAKDELFQVWRAYCEARGLHAGTISRFSSNLMAAFPGKVKPSKERRGGKTRIPVYQGVRLLQANPDIPF
ncbi:phage/plasmid primase, P4 family [Mesorhizobium sp. KR2-14]|uniref:phage/plasmid primase, P4 family n=1 Tax=Mesorhizobium sp. KR2-14 TaxID=3156610 RepID=UPI0032B5FE91